MASCISGSVHKSQPADSTHSVKTESLVLDDLVYPAMQRDIAAMIEPKIKLSGEVKLAAPEVYSALAEVIGQSASRIESLPRDFALSIGIQASKIEATLYCPVPDSAIRILDITLLELNGQITPVQLETAQGSLRKAIEKLGALALKPGAEAAGS